tara:strand:+ start:445 stop:1485 length:1041 start_codon:yes stop_codon:yes gene_type:complete
MRRILVTGGCGFIGSHTCLELLEKNYEVWVVDSLVNSSHLVLERIKKLSNKSNNLKFFKGDVRDINFIRKVFQKAINNDIPISGVIHFAGLKSVGESIDEPIKYWDVNVNGTISLIRVMEESNCRSIVFSSSATIYGIKDDTPIKESFDIESINPYGTTKIVIEKLLKDLYLSSPDEWRIISLRYFNPIGAHESGLIGEDPLGIPNNIFPLLMQVCMRRINKLQVFGNDWDTKDGTCVRDYIHVLDLADGHILAMEYLFNHNPQIMNLNLGTGTGTSVLELINTFERVNNVSIPYEFTERRKGDYASVIADNSKLVKILNWQPRRDLLKMCMDGWRWQKSNPKGYY